MTPEEKIEKLLKNREEILRYLAAVVDRAGGEVRLSVPELSVNRVLQKEEIGLTGVVRLTVEKPEGR